MSQSGNQSPESSVDALDADKLALSALQDDQADDLQLRRLLKALESDPARGEELLATWQRYHLAQDVLHDRGIPVRADFASRVATRLEQEPAHRARGGLSGWQQNLTKLAIAASVAAVFVVGLQGSLSNDSSAPAVADNTQDTASAPAVEPTMLATSAEFEMDPVAAERLRNYLESVAIDVTEPVVTEHIQDSPLYRLVNEIQDD